MSARLVVLYGPPVDPAAFDAYFEDRHVPLVKLCPVFGGLRPAPDRSARPMVPRHITASALTVGLEEELRLALNSLKAQERLGT